MQNIVYKQTEPGFHHDYVAVTLVKFEIKLYNDTCINQCHPHPFHARAEPELMTSAMNQTLAFCSTACARKMSITLALTSAHYMNSRRKPQTGHAASRNTRDSYNGICFSREDLAIPSRKVLIVKLRVAEYLYNPSDQPLVIYCFFVRVQTSSMTPYNLESLND